MDYNIALLPGDGIGPEIVEQAVVVLKAVGRLYGHSFMFREAKVGGCAIDAYGVPITDETLDMAISADAVLLGAVGGPKWDSVAPSIRPEKALFALRKGLGLYANLRPVTLQPALLKASTLKPEIIEGVDMIVVRELTGGLYFGEPRYRKPLETGNGEVAVDTLVYTTPEIERIAHKAFQIARTRQKKVSSVDKANVIDNSRLWRETVSRIADEYPDVTLEHVLVDNCAMQLVRNPRQFDVIVTENLFGDILSDEAAMLTGSIGMLPSASIGDSKCALYEPIHGSAPDIAGQDKANPLATILSAAMLLRHSFKLEECAASIENAVRKVLESGHRTGDIMEPGAIAVGTAEMGRLVMECLG